MKGTSAVSDEDQMNQQEYSNPDETAQGSVLDSMESRAEFAEKTHEEFLSGDTAGDVNYDPFSSGGDVMGFQNDRYTQDQMNQ